MKKAKKKQAGPILDLNTPEAVEEFKKASEKVMRRLTRTPEAAMAFLVKTGIYTKTGRLSKHYR